MRFLLVALFMMLTPGAGESRPYEGNQQQSAEQQPADQPPVKPNAATPEVFGADSPADSHDGATAQYRQEQTQQYLLLGEPPAQWLMAFTAFGGLIVSVWAVCLLRKTLHATHAAVREARRGTVAAARSARLAEDAVTVARDTARRELRAYITISRVRFTGLGDGDSAKFEVRFRNVGSTPAKKVKSRIWTTVGAGESQGKIFSGGESIGESVADLGQGSEFIMTDTVYGGPLSPMEHKHVLTGTKSLYVVGIITYEDVFRVTRRTLLKGSLALDSIDINGNGKITPSRTGNRST